MKFNIAHLNKVKLIQTLYKHAEPKGYGEIEYARLLEAGEPVYELNAAECHKITRRTARMNFGYLIDYHNGKPLKIQWKKISGGLTVMESVPYDLLHGKYRFLEAMLDVFKKDEIRILDKSYSPNYETDFREFKRRKIEKQMEAMLDDMVLMVDDENYCYWSLDTRAVIG